jgi:hypothetical protein
VVLTDPQQGIEVVDLPALSDPELQAVMALEPVRRISKDLKDSARQLSRRQATYLVTLYYQIQGFRIRAENQERASAAAEQPNDFVHWTNQQMGRVEQVIATALDSYSTFHPLGQWAKSIDGIGKIIAAGFLAILDEAPPPTVGHWWRFAGLDPTLEWLGTERAGKVVTEVMGTRKDVTPADLVAISQLTNRSLESLRRFALSEKGKPSEDEMRKLLNVVVAALAMNDMEQARDALSENGIHIDAIEGLTLDAQRGLLTPLGEATLAIRDAMREKFTADFGGQRARLVAGLARRPWNADLRVLAWKAGESFVKVSGKETATYGHLYLMRKAYEAQKNERGDYADQAETWAKRVGKETIAYQHYKEGRLPPGHLHSRAKRYAVKIFISHWHTCAYFLRFGQLPVKPYAIEHLGHAHLTLPPNSHMIPGLTEALEPWRQMYTASS